MLTQARLKELLHYNPDTGQFTWRHDCGLPRVAGKFAGYVNDQGYVVVKTSGQGHGAHRLAWLYTRGCWPSHYIDHIDGCRSDNRMTNLREATHGQNISNSPRPSHNTSGFKGVSKLDRRAPSWRATIIHNKRQVYLGTFDTPEKAHKAYCTAADKYHKEFANHG